jgi:hypothetical protein
MVRSATVQAMPTCQFGGGKVPSTSLIRRFFNAIGDFLLQAWSTLSLTFKKTVPHKVTHDHEIGHMVSAYASGVKPLAVSFKEKATHIVNSFKNMGNSNTPDKLAKSYWNLMSGSVFGNMSKRDGKFIFQFPEGTCGDVAAMIMHAEDAGLKNPLLTDLGQKAEKTLSKKATDIDANSYVDALMQTILKDGNAGFHKVMAKLAQLKTAMGYEKLEQLRQGVLNKNGWMFGKTFRTQLYEKVFTAVERQQFEKIYQEFEREFIALPEIQALAKKS